MEGDMWARCWVSLSIVVLMVASLFAMTPAVIRAPPASGTLSVTWESMSPMTNTFQGDLNLTLLWLAFEAQGDDITLENIGVEVYGLPPDGINRTFAWDNRNGDYNLSYEECVIGEDSTAPYLLPPAGQMLECTGPDIGSPVVIQQDKTRRFMIVMDLNFDPAEQHTDKDLRACVEPGSITSSASNVVGLPACSRTIDVNTRFFYDDMEHGQGGWTFEGGDAGGQHPNGLWHLSQGEEECINNLDKLDYYISANTSWWYGHRYLWFGDWVCNYYTYDEVPTQPSWNWGRLRTPWIDARRGTSLSMTLWHLLSREPNEGVDTAEIYLNDGSGWKFISSQWSTDGYWWKLTFNLSAYAGEQVQLEFRFDTMDETNNMYMGWFLDELAVYGEILDHDVAITELTLDKYISLDPQEVVVRVSNIGASDETNIEVNLTRDGILVDQTAVPFLASEDNTTVTLGWTPPGEGSYEICVETTPVPGETVLWNNRQCTLVNATAQEVTKVAILRSYGTQGLGPRATWDYLNAHWDDYGLEPIVIDYITLDKYPITYHDIQTTDADVLVLSGSGYYYGEPMGRELDDLETMAIEKYVTEGYGFVTIGTAFNIYVPNNNDLVHLVGIKDQAYERASIGGIRVESSCANHSIFTNIPNSFAFGFNRSMVPFDDMKWGVDDLDGGQICAASLDNASAIIIHKGAVMLSFGADVTPSEEEYQLLYNSFVWSRYVSRDYDVRVSGLAVPRFTRPSYPISITSIVTNLGKQPLPTVQVDLKIDGLPVDTLVLSNMAHGERRYANFTWTPVSVGTYQTCVFADIVGFTDEDPSNNEVCTSVEVTDNPPVLVYVLDSWGTDFPEEAPWDYLNEEWSNHGAIPVYVDYDMFNKENIHYEELVNSQADVLLISSSKSGNLTHPVENGYLFSEDELDAIARYTEDGHGLIATGLTFDSLNLSSHSFTLGPLFGLNSGNSYSSTDEINDLYVIDPSENHPLFMGIPDNYATAHGTTVTPGFPTPAIWENKYLDEGEFKAFSTPTRYGAVITHDHSNYSAVYITNFVENISNDNDKQLLYNAMIWTRTGVQPPDDLWIYKAGAGLRLEWVEPVTTKIDGYRIYKATSVNGFDFGDPVDDVPYGTNQWMDPLSDAGLDSNSYFYIVRSYDKKGNEEMNTNKVGKTVTELYKGTNEISIGFELKDHSTITAFESVDGLYKSIEAFDPYTCTWSSWTPTGGTLIEIHRSMGLRVRMHSDGLLISVGRVTSTSIDMPEVSACGNWVFAGFPSFETRPLPGVLDENGMMGKYDLVLWFDPLDKRQRWKWFDPNDPGGSPLKELVPGMGIWIHVTQAGVWEVSGD